MGDTGEDRNWRARVALGASQPIGWWLAARDLKAGADALAEALEVLEPPSVDSRPASDNDEFGIRRVYMMLMGFALENLLKGILLSLDPDRYVREADKLFSWGRDGHDLVALTRLAGIELAEDEVDLCRRLSRFATWAGRYWFPMSVKQMESDSGFSPVFNMSADDRDVAERLYQAWSTRLQPRIAQDEVE